MSNLRSLNKLKKNAKAISPLIATLLLIAIAVAASVITYSWVMSMIGSQSQQAQTSIRIDSINWGNNTAGVVVRNVGSVSATVESVSLRKNITGSPFTTVSYTTDNSLPTAGTKTFAWSGALAPSTEYVVRVTTTTGFQYEMSSTTPS